MPTDAELDAQVDETTAAVGNALFWRLFS